MKVTLISKINWLQVAHVYFYGVPFSTEREWEKKKKSEKKKGEKAVTLSCFLRSNIDTMANNRMHQTQQQLLFGVYSRREGRNVGSFSWTAAARSSPKKSDGYFFFSAFSRKLFSPLHRCAYSLHCSRSFSGEFKGLF